MSANNCNSDSSYRLPHLPSSASGRTVASGIDLPPSRYSPQSQPSQSQVDEQNPHSSCMSTLTLRPSSMLPSPRHLLWEDSQSPGPSSGPRPPLQRIEKVELPSIRQAIPEIQMRANRGVESEFRTEPVAYSPPTATGASVMVSDHVRSSSQRKRRRLSADDDNDIESRERIIQRMNRSPPRNSRTPSLMASPTGSARRTSALSSAESWTSSTRGNSPYISAQGPTGIRSPPPFDSNLPRSEWRPTLPSLPSLTLERGPIQPPRGHSHWSEYAFETTRSGAQTYPQLSTSFEPPPSAYIPPAFTYGYQQPRGQSYSGPSSHSLDRTPFSASHHHSGYPGASHPYGIEMNDGIDAKQRKRRGNLPKETTDKLRAWFVAHLHHPYPTEDEKQELMRQTGLQMNQISNWFINARRRQLPAMINNARAESDARSARVDDRSEGVNDYGDEREKRAALPLGESDGEGSYDDEYDERLRQRFQGKPKRESI